MLKQIQQTMAYEPQVFIFKLEVGGGSQVFQGQSAGAAVQDL